MSKIHISTLLKHYKKDDVQRAILACAEDKEVAVRYGDHGFGKRPDVLKYPRDILEFAKKGATSFHCSEELWHNPLSVVTGMKPQELNNLRKGWDLVLDIDCAELEYSKIAAHLIVEALKHFDVGCASVKFSGNHGFHIGVPFEAFPEFVANDRSVKDLFPEGPKRVALFLQEKIRDHLARRLGEHDSLDMMARKVGKSPNGLMKDGVFDPFEVVHIDTVLIAPRHLYRMPWSFNEKSGLVSVVIPAGSIMSFTRKQAVPYRVDPSLRFLDKSKVVRGEAKRLFVEAFDFEPSIEKSAVKDDAEFDVIQDAIPLDFFPPCIKRISEGIEDGRKRAVLVLINFLSSVGWSYDMIEGFLEEWNKRNAEPLREVYYKGQLRYHRQQKKNAPPPNCDNKAYLLDMGVCRPDVFCKRIKNPVTYAIMRQRFSSKTKVRK